MLSLLGKWVWYWHVGFTFPQWIASLRVWASLTYFRMAFSGTPILLMQLQHTWTTSHIHNCCVSTKTKNTNRTCHEDRKCSQHTHTKLLCIAGPSYSWCYLHWTTWLQNWKAAATIESLLPLYSSHCTSGHPLVLASSFSCSYCTVTTIETAHRFFFFFYNANPRGNKTVKKIWWFVLVENSQDVGVKAAKFSSGINKRSNHSWLVDSTTTGGLCLRKEGRIESRR